MHAEQSPYSAWENGPGAGADYFPIAVWLQSPRNAPKYQAIGINLYVGLWQGPTEQQLAELKRHGMPVICAQNEYALRHLDDKTMVGWMHGDEPDNAQSLGSGKGYGPPVPPQKIIADYRAIKAADPSRPVMLNLGQGVAWDGWIGRGVRTNHPEDYAEYARGCDVASFDIYPAVSERAAVAGKLWYVPRGVKRLRQWTRDEKPVWNCIECTRISNPNTKPTPVQVKAEVWMALIHGSRGLIYFSHQFQPQFIEAGLLADPQMSAAVGAINRRIHSLARVLNGPTVDGAVTVTAEPADVSPRRSELLGPEPVAAMVKRNEGATYVFTVRMEGEPAKATFRLRDLPARATAEVVDEDRSIPVADGQFADDFGPYDVHLYKIR
ncbi:MAG: hypothetical protein JXB62_12225 [Pirellulales bacterium]|nr:hypothetical protein [Pirellulales bacterium]